MIQAAAKAFEILGDEVKKSDLGSIMMDDGSWSPNYENIKFDENDTNNIEIRRDGSDCNELPDDFNKSIEQQCSSEGIQNIRDNYENVDKVMRSIKDGLENASSDVDLQKEMKRVERYKGTIFEDMCKESLSDKFESIDIKQKSVETSEGVTKPDIVLHDAKDDFSIGDMEIKKGESLYAEVKCGSADYIESEMPHIQKQVLGHNDGKSVVILSKDYLEIDPNKRAQFEADLKNKGSGVVVTDTYGSQVEDAMLENLLG